MKAVTIKILKDELKNRPSAEVLNLCMRLARFKKENKELLTYLLFEADHEESFIAGVKEIIDDRFLKINTRTDYFRRKGLRAVLKEAKKFIRYSPKKATEIELLLYYCAKMKETVPHMSATRRIHAIYEKQMEMIHRKLPTLHEDLQYDFQQMIDALEGNGN